jgi:hypothetical protein
MKIQSTVFDWLYKSKALFPIFPKYGTIDYFLKPLSFLFIGGNMPLYFKHLPMNFSFFIPMKCLCFFLLY